MVELFPPKQGFSKGTRQGILVVIPLLAVLLGVSLFADVAPQQPLAITLDFIAGTAAAVTAVWIVGGLFEISGKILDVGVKAAGGAAVLAIIVIWVRPYYNSGSYAPNPVSVTLPAYEPISFFIDLVNRDFREGRGKEQVRATNAAILRLRPRPLDADLAYAGGSWPEIFRKISTDAPCLTVAVDQLVIALGTSVGPVPQDTPAGQVYVCP